MPRYRGPALRYARFHPLILVLPFLQARLFPVPPHASIALRDPGLLRLSFRLWYREVWQRRRLGRCREAWGLRHSASGRCVSPIAARNTPCHRSACSAAWATLTSVITNTAVQFLLLAGSRSCGAVPPLRCAQPLRLRLHLWRPPPAPDWRPCTAVADPPNPPSSFLRPSQPSLRGVRR